jgi:hypothetical protein
MKPKNLRILSASLVLVILQACSSTAVGPASTQVGVNPGTSTLVPATATSIPATATPIPFVAETGGPAGFSASLAAPDIVSLTWQPDAGAVGYDLQLVYDNLGPLTIAHLPSDSTSFEHILAPESSLLTYRLQTITSSGPGGVSSLQIATLGHHPNPLTVKAAFSENGVVSATIGPLGGTLETTDERGVTYTLVIPPAALTTEVEIKMTPVSAIDGWPLSGDFLGAVRLEPEGWLLDELATLTIRMPASSSPALPPVGFAFTGSGEEFHLAPASSDPAPIASVGKSQASPVNPLLQQNVRVIRLPVMELRTSGLGVTSADSAALLAAENAPTSSSDAVDQKAAATEVALDELAPLLSHAQLGEIATNNLQIQIHGAQDCYDFKRAVGSFHAWEAKVAQLGDNYSADRQVLLDELANKAVETIEKASDECVNADKGVVPASIPCAEKLTRDIQSAGTVPGSDPFFVDLKNAITQDPGLKDRMTAADPNTIAASRCPHSFKVNEATSLGYRWSSGCIPSLDRPYQLVWIGNGIHGNYRLYPSGPFSGRVEGQGIVDSVPGATVTIEYAGRYSIAVTKTDNLGNPQELNATLTMQQTMTQCIQGATCETSTGAGGQEIPLLVNSQRCPLP